MKCALCLEDKELQKSHIFPEFLYAKIYDPGHKYFAISLSSEERNKLRRKGTYELLLCDSCEKRIGVFEDYAAKILNGGAEIGIEHQKDRMLIHNVDYLKFKLFQVSLIWRSGVSSLPEFSGIKLGPHLDIMRKMILESNPLEPYQYGCIVSFISEATELMKAFIYIPDPVKKINGFQFYRSIFGGLFWTYLVSSHGERFPFQPAFIDKSNILPVFNGSEYGMPFLVSIKDDFLKKFPATA